jgi:hypothetical protein
MEEGDSETIIILRKIHELLELLAEDKIAARDASMRAKLKATVGSSERKQKSVLLMDGTRTQAEIRKVTDLNQGHLSTLVSALGKEGLLVGDIKRPNLAIRVPEKFFDAEPA